MKNNQHKKQSFIDRFARHFYCQHARLNQLRADKRYGKRLVRRQNKDEMRKEQYGT